jgi:hypothetical protein
MAHVLGFDESLDIPVELQLSNGVKSRGIFDVAKFKHAHLVPFAKPALPLHVLLASKPILGSTTLQDENLQSQQDLDAAISQGAYAMDHLYDASMPTWLFENLLEYKNTIVGRSLSAAIWGELLGTQKQTNLVYWHNVGIGQYSNVDNGGIGLAKNKLDQIYGHFRVDAIPNRAAFGTYQRGQSYQAQNVCHDHQQFGISTVTFLEIKEALRQKGLVYLGSHSERDLRGELYDEEQLRGFILPSIFVSVYQRPPDMRSPAILHRFSPEDPSRNIGQLMNDTLRKLHGEDKLADSKALTTQASRFYENLELR